MKHYYSIYETAKVLGVTERMVWNYIRKGELKTVRKKYRKSGRKRLWVELLSLEKCLIRKKYPAIYGTRDYMVRYFKEQFIKQSELRVAFQEVGIMAEKDILNGLEYFSEFNEEELDQIIERGTELWNIRDVAAYMEVSLRTVQRYINQGKLKLEEIAESGEKLFSNLDVMELYREKKGCQTECSEEEAECSEEEDKQAIYTFIEEHPECIPIFKKAIDGLLQ